jgi:hypothetical protein
LVALPARRGWHFPRGEKGRYAGYYPADSEAAVAHLEDLRALGAEYLVIPSTSFWWLDYYDGLADHLEEHYEAVAHTDTAVVYALGVTAAVQIERRPAPEHHHRADQIRSYLAHLLPEEVVVAVASNGDPEILALEQEVWHFPRPASGEYAGFALANTEAALRHADELANRGASFLVIPALEPEWLDGYPGLIDELEKRWRLVARQQHVCTVFDLTDRSRSSR